MNTTIRTSAAVTALALGLVSCASNKVSPEVESLKKENESLKEEVEKLEKRGKDRTVLSNRQFAAGEGIGFGNFSSMLAKTGTVAISASGKSSWDGISVWGTGI